MVEDTRRRKHTHIEIALALFSTKMSTVDCNALCDYVTATLNDNIFLAGNFKVVERIFIAFFRLLLVKLAIGDQTTHSSITILESTVTHPLLDHSNLSPVEGPC